MEKRIELECRGVPPSKITELNLDNCRATTIEGLTAQYSNLTKLSMIAVGLTTLRGFPELPNLRKLELSDNRISSGLSFLSGSPLLTSLTLSGNKIKDFETLQPLADFKHLKSLDLFNCEVTSEESYRDEVFSILPQLLYLDGYDRNDREADEDEDDEDDEEEDEEDEEEEEKEDDEEEDGAGVKAEGASDSDEAGQESGSEFADEDDSDAVWGGDSDAEDGQGDLEDGDSDLDDEEEDVGLDYLQKNIENESDGGEFTPDEEEDDDDLAESDDDAAAAAAEPRGEKRKRDEDDEEEDE